jgi:hypothetical protein
MTLKFCLQLLFFLSLAVRVVALARHLRRAWRGSPPPLSSGNLLAQAFQRELRRRGQLLDLPLSQPD